jgi:hypothetical protein
MSQVVDFFGVDFEADNLFFGADLEDLPGVYILYTDKKCLDLGQTSKLASEIDEHLNASSWVKEADREDIFLAFHQEEDREKRLDVVEELRPKLNPVAPRVPNLY